MQINLSGKTALVTGSTQAIWAAIAEASATTGGALRVDGGDVESILP